MDQKTFQHEHGEYVHHIERLTLMAAAAPGTLPENRLTALIELEAKDLLRGLGIHFAFEEEGGYLANVVARRPDLAPRVEAAHADHAAIRSALVALIRSAGSASAPDLQAQTNDLLSLLQRHEAAEIDLLQEAFDRDLGAAD